MEKFLRRNSYSSGDERDTTASITTSKSNRNKTKSLESVNEAARQEAIITSQPKSPKTPPRKAEPEASKPMEPTKVVVKQTSEKVDKKKSFNYESIIEITLPQQPAQIQSMPMLQGDQSKDRSETIEEPIKPIICTPKQSKIPLQTQTSGDKRMSPSSGNDESFVSNKQNPLMEWDSFIPVSILFVAMQFIIFDIKSFCKKRAMKQKRHYCKRTTCNYAIRWSSTITN